MYRITHNEGEIFVNVSAGTTGYSAHLKDDKNKVEASLTGENEDDLYYKCRSWASSNIHGEFLLEALQSHGKAASLFEGLK